MATKAERAKARTQRSAWSKRPRKTKVHTSKSEAQEAGRARRAEDAAASTSGHYAGGVTAIRNVVRDEGEHATHELEDAATGRPSRKSTRKGANRSKPDSQLRRRAMRKTSSPKERAARGE